MRLSVFTPTHDPRFLPRLEASLARQTWVDFEWLIVPNGAARPADIRVALPQARIVPYPGAAEKVGELKHFCCSRARGEVLVEVDHDDELTPDALAEVAAAFASDPGLSFAYSNCCEIRDGRPWRYSEEYGWAYRPFAWGAGQFFETVAFDPSPAAFSKIWYAPNHIRAWRADFYRAIGGHDRTRAVLDDHDLLARTYIHGTVRKIDRCLYVYHHHGANTCQGELNSYIQVETLNLHDRYIEALVLKWCDLNGLPRVDLGALDRTMLSGRWPFADGEVGLFTAPDVLCKLPAPAHTMSEAYRCLAPNGWFLTDTPSTDGRGAFQDPRHCSFWNANSFWYYTRQPHAGFIGTPVRFQLNRVKDHYPSSWYEQHQMPYVRADLLKCAGRVPGPVGFPDHEAEAPRPAGAAVTMPAVPRAPGIKFTLLTPTIERDTLIRCCRSVERQTHGLWQHLVVLDGPAWTIPLDELRHPNRTFLVSGRRHHDVGNTARHLAYDHIAGDYVIGLDDDNYLLHDRVLEVLAGALDGSDWAVYPIVAGGSWFFLDPPGRGRTDQAQMVYRPVIRGQEVRYPRVQDYDGDGLLCEWLKSLAPPRMLGGVGPLVMYERAAGATPEPGLWEHPKVRDLLAKTWPEARPDRPFDGQGWLNDGVAPMLARYVGDRARLVVELGSWLGLSTRWLLDRAPRAVVVAVDHWRGSPELAAFADKVPHLFDTFLANNWDYRGRLLPLRATTREGLQAVADLDLARPPDLIFLDADHSEAEVAADILRAAVLFPATPLVGDDFVLPGVRAAVHACAGRLGKRLETLGYAWSLT
jgi:glycosyltransferase involved in cell wall biosynthesis